MSKELQPEDLLNRVAQRDVAAFGEIYDRYAPRVYGLIAHILPSRQAADEVLQEVFLRLWSEGQNLSREGGSVVAWLVVSARAAAVDRLRQLLPGVPIASPLVHKAQSNKRPGGNARKAKGSTAVKYPTGKSEAAKPQPAGATSSPSKRFFPPAWLPLPREIALIDDRLALLHKAISQLPEPQRQALDLAVYGGRSESEIATEMGEPLGKAQRSLRAAVTFVKHRRRAVCGTWAANI
jgi:RNA polymerase sigma-70 factor (ECF subfamily)